VHQELYSRMYYSMKKVTVAVHHQCIMYDGKFSAFLPLNAYAQVFSISLLGVDIFL
jgi:hypothetical protein